MTEYNRFMRKYRPLLVAVIALLFYTITDILIWQRVFETNKLVIYASTYHTGWFMSLAGYAAIGIVLMWDSFKDVIYFLTFLVIGAFSGLEDVLYYILDRRPIPPSLPWLSNNPMIFASSRIGLVSSVLFWLTALVVLYLVLYIWRNNRKAHLIDTHMHM